MKKIIIILVLSLLAIGCVERNNPYDPGSDNFNEELLLSDVMKFLPDTIGSADGTVINLRSINLSGSATSIHIEFDKHDLIIDSVNVSHNKENALVTFNGNILNINYTSGLPIGGTMDIANIYLSALPQSGKLQYTGTLFNDNVPDNAQSEVVYVDFWGEPLIK